MFRSDGQVTAISDVTLSQVQFIVVCMAVPKVLFRPEVRGTSCVQVGAGHLGLLLRAVPGISKLNLRENELGDKGVTLLAQSLAGNTALISLELSQNEVRNPPLEWTPCCSTC
jgi:hypothetical protein